MARKTGAGTLRVKAVKARFQINDRLEAGRERRQTDLQVGMPEESSSPFYNWTIDSIDVARSEDRLRAIL